MGDIAILCVPVPVARRFSDESTLFNCTDKLPTVSGSRKSSLAFDTAYRGDKIHLT